MAKDQIKDQQTEPVQEPAQEPAAEPVSEAKESKKDKKNKKADEAAKLHEELAAEQDKYLRLAAEYDNFRKRSQKEKDNIYTDARVDVIGKFLPVYDNLERAIAQESADEAYKKGVELTMNGLLEIFQKLDVEIFGEKGDPFDPNFHNAVMHCEDETLGENVLSEVFQKGFRIGERVIRFAMVRVAN